MGLASDVRSAQEWNLNLLQFLMTLGGSLASIVVFSFLTFQTKQEAEKERLFVEQRMQSIESLIIDLKVDMRERHSQTHNDLQNIQDGLIYLKQRSKENK